jgi:hypothetical protein
MFFTDTELGVFLEDEAEYLYFGAETESVPVTLQIDFRERYQLVLDGVESTAPVAHIRTSDISLYGIKHTDQLIINSLTYRITGMQNQGDGMTTLLLEISED